MALIVTNCVALVVHNGAPFGSFSVQGQLTADYERHEESGEGDDNVTRWTHILAVGWPNDIRDGYDGGVQIGSQDTVYIPPNTLTGTPFTVRFVETKARGTGFTYLKVYLDRGTPPWPTSNL
jgi:hypothetical protein